MEATDWASLSDQDLLERRISKLGLRLDGTALDPLIRQFYDELSANGHVYHLPLTRSHQARRAAESLRFSGSG